MNAIFLVMVLLAFVIAAGHQLLGLPVPGQDLPAMEALTKGMLDGAKGSVDLAIGLVGAMTLFLGLMKVAEAGGMLTILARLIRPVLIRLFPDVPPDHPAMGAMILNMSANALGLGNAATPFGIRAMQELDKLNPHKGTATNAMALFLAINTSAVTLLPSGVIALRASAGSTSPAAIFIPTLFATLCSTTAAIAAAKLYQRFSPLPEPDADAVVEHDAPAEALPDAATGAYPFWVSGIALLAMLSLLPLAILFQERVQAAAAWVIPMIMAGLLTFGAVRKVRVYEVFVEGARDGFQVAVKIIPYMVAILSAVGMLRASGALDMMVGVLGPITSPLGLPAEALPMALMRPLSGNGAYGVLAALIQDPTIGPDSYTGLLVSTLQGSTETTFYVLAVYFGAVQVQRLRHAMWAALTADVAGVAGAVVACNLFT